MRARRGVLLLIVLALLAMFGLVGITFVILTSQSRRGAEAQRRVEEYADPPDDLAHQVALQILRGSASPASVLRDHSLLEDLYGLPVYEGVLPPVTPTAGGQLYEFAITDPNMLRYCGCVLTIRSGAAAGQSTRIVGYAQHGGSYWLQYVAFAGGQVPAANDLCTINGAPFSGTGFGYNSTAAATDPLLTAVDPTPYTTTSGTTYVPYALSPNPVAFQPNATLSYTDPAGPGGANEDYDAPDYQNMLLALQVPEATNIGSLAVPAGTTPLPSLHRPELVNYWFHKLDTILDNSTTYGSGTVAQKTQYFCNALSLPSLAEAKIIADLKRRATLRPLIEDNPNFTGSNPYFHPLWDGYTTDVDGNGVPEGYRWDVDNDGDGIADSIWVDVGLPVRSTKDGRLYKPLVAILCVDLDGRLNLNAHGSLAQVDNAWQGSATFPAAIVAGGANQLTVPRGQGVGPAEVNLLPVLCLDTLNLTTADYTAYTSLLQSRYGTDAQPGLPGCAIIGGVAYSYDYLAANLVSDYPSIYPLSGSAPAAAMAYGTPMDFSGGVALGLDLRGQPLYATLLSAEVAAASGGLQPADGSYLRSYDRPYELNLSRNNPAADSTFSVAELERLLRPFDADAQTLPGRLLALVPSLATSARAVAARHEVTTESRDLPCPAAVFPAKLRVPDDASAQARVSAWLSTLKGNHVANLLGAKLVAENSTLLDPATLASMTGWLLPPELMAGVRMDLNRPFGNGVDDDGNNVVDEPAEAFVGEVIRQAQGVNASGDPITVMVAMNHTDGVDVNGDGSVNGTDFALARQLYARYLYVQMLLMMDYHVATPGSPSTEEKAVARKVAQWAVNIVDFRDRDAIMTPFEYDIEPFYDEDGNGNPWDGDGNPWDVDSVIGTTASPSADDAADYRGLVWGCERPELLITETLAMHDRRTEDLDTDPTGDKVATDGDNDFDQRFRPEGSLFIELHNPWSSSEAPPGELSTSGGIDLTKTSPVGGSPVWRLVLVRVDPTAALGNDPDAEDEPKDPDDPIVAHRPDSDRSIYFVGDSVSPPAEGDITFQPSDDLSDKIAPVLPGRYAVVGPGHTTDDSTSTTYFGFRNGQVAGDNQTRRIVLTPNVDTTIKQVWVFGDGATDDLNRTAPAVIIDDTTNANRTIERATAIIINHPQRLSVTEPVGAYPAYPAGQTQYVPPYDDPLDKGGPFWDSDPVKLKDNQTLSGAWVVHLQRLANPLLAYDKDTNPYRTIDSMPVDLTTFNGVTTERDNANEKPGSDTNELGDDKDLFARERGDKDASSMNLWAEDPAASLHTAAQRAATTVTLADLHYFDTKLTHSLGYLNAAYGIPHAPVTGYLGSPQSPFPWLTWLNRPFASEMELFLVPKTRSSQLLRDFTTAPATPDPDPYTNSSQPYPQLVNFFFNDPPAGEPVDWRLYRVLDMLRVPSRFVGAELQGNPTAFAYSPTTAPHAFYPPFNRIPGLRDPGLVNLNTIASPRVWQGLMGSTSSLTAFDTLWGDLVKSRRGYDTSAAWAMAAPSTAADHLWMIDNESPTRFENPFRSASGKYLVPTEELKDEAVKEEVNATLLRQKPSTVEQPLFEFDAASSTLANNPDRNPYFRYQLYDRLGSMTTTRSNVYAVWITIGYFEVEPAVNTLGLSAAEFQRVHPDGCALGRELGSDTGETARHRAFYILDRSIPVGFQRGKDLNVEKAILLRRFIE